MAAKLGAKTILIARNEKALSNLASKLNQENMTSKCFVADVANEEELEKVGQEAWNAFGRIDTWVNNAGVSIYGKLEEVSDSDSRGLFDTNFFGGGGETDLESPHA